MSNRPPFLTLDRQVDYLYRKDYFAPNSFLEEDIARLKSMNFHYFLGYARNFRELYFQRKLTGEKTPSRVFKLIDVDAEVSSLFRDPKCRVAVEAFSCSRILQQI